MTLHQERARGAFQASVVRLVLDLKTEVKPQLFVLKRSQNTAIAGIGRISRPSA